MNFNRKIHQQLFIAARGPKIGSRRDAEAQRKHGALLSSLRLSVSARASFLRIRICLVVFAAIALLSIPAHAADQPPAPVITMQTLLTDMIDFDAVARWPKQPFTVRQASSYDRARISPDKPGWFANNDGTGFIRTEKRAGHEEHVLLDTDGPGAIVRFFFTSSGSRAAHIRIYLDGADDAAIDWPTLDMMKDVLAVAEPLKKRHPAPLGHGGGTLYLPIPYARHCKVAIEESNPAEKGNRYFQIGYRTYAADTKIETFTPAVLEAARPEIDKANQLLIDPPTAATTGSATISCVLNGHEGKSVELPAGPSAVRRLEMSIASDLPPAAKEQALRSVVIRASFDTEGETVWCPVGDFLGSGTGGRAVTSWYRTVGDDGKAISRWSMPYQKQGAITLENLGTVPVNVNLITRTSPWQWDDRSMYFHCNWHQQTKIPVRPFRDWNFVTISGRGVLAGDVMSVFNPVAAWYGEGNEKIWVDGESFPSHLGTGTEDYYNASWAPNPVFQGPFSNHPRIDEPHGQGQNVYTRSRNLDAIPFTKSLQFDFEIETWRENYAVDYAATSYWYGSPGAKCNLQPAPEEARRPVPVLPARMSIPGAIECEALHLANKSSGVVVEPQEMTPFKGKWSNDAQLLIRGKKEGDYVDIEIPVAAATPQRVVLYATQANDYGILKFTVNGNPVDESFDGYAPDPTPSSPIPLGVFTPVDGKLVLRVELAGTNPKSIGGRYLVGLDAVVVSEK